MRLKPGCAAEYRKRHDEIWPELSREIAAAGIRDYAIYLDEATDTLFAHHQLIDGNTADQLPQTAIVRKWWSYMADIMETNPDDSPVQKPLSLMFYAP